MKKVLLFAAAALVMAGCQNDDLVTNEQDQGNPSPEISFGTYMPGLTRASNMFTGKEAAEKLSNHFLVHGFKYFGTEPTSYAEIHNPARQQNVFDFYNVMYQDGTANSTPSNTTNWEYVGYQSQSGQDQTIKYWDYDASGYVFSAVSGAGITGEKIDVTSPESVYGKGWNITIPAGGSLSNLYASERTPMPKPATGTEYDLVNLKFYSLATKIRFAIYETVSGYSVKIDRFYYNDGSKWHKTENNFAVTGDFRTLNTSRDTKIQVTYYDDKSGIENRPKVSVSAADVTSEVCKLFGSNIQAQSAIGTSTVDATYDQSGQAYTYILPYANTKELTLYVDYTLTAANGETIHVKHASAHVPTGYLQWKENFAYTYLFKISDQTNGTTGDQGDPKDPSDPDDPTGDPNDPAGLYPITFDACVVSSDEGIQETVTTVSEPSITTYQKGEVVTENNEYEAGDIYYTVIRDNTICSDLSTSAKVYEVTNYGKEELTEAVISNYANNFVVLTPVATTEALQVPKTDGTYITFLPGTCYTFPAKAGKFYAIQYTDLDKTLKTRVTYKLVKVVGDDKAAPAYTLTGDTQKVTDHDTKLTYTLSNADGTGVLGAAPLLSVWTSANEDATDLFQIAELGEGKYSVVLTQEAVNAGADGTYTLYFNGKNVKAKSFEVALGYTLSPSEVDVVAGGTGATITLTLDNSAFNLPGALITGVPQGLTVTDNADGTYSLSADNAMKSGKYTLEIAGKTLNVNVVVYAFASDKVNIVKEYGKNTQAKVVLNKNGKKSSISADALTGADPQVASVTGTGEYTITAQKGGQFTLKYEATQCEVSVEEYAMSADVASFAKSTGKAMLTVKKNGQVINARSTNVEVLRDGTSVTSGFLLEARHSELEFSNVTVSGNYTIKYKVGSVVVAETSVEVVQP